MSLISYTIVESLVGDLIIYGTESSLMGVGFLRARDWTKERETWVERPEVFREIIGQLRGYFSGTLKRFEMPISLSGTEFQRSIYRQLINIPYGETRSYSDIAEAIGNKKAVRAIGNANSKNPIAIVVPCHRVIGRDGSLTGLAGGIDLYKIIFGLQKTRN